MRIEHVGYMVQDPPTVAQWYCEHLGFRVARKMDQSPWTHFLVDGSGRVMLEIYNNPKARVPDYAAMDALILHVAFSVDDVAGERSRLLAAGAAAEGEIAVIGCGDELAMLRDPWGFPIQLAKRAEPMVS